MLPPSEAEREPPKFPSGDQVSQSASKSGRQALTGRTHHAPPRPWAQAQVGLALHMRMRAFWGILCQPSIIMHLLLHARTLRALSYSY